MDGWMDMVVACGGGGDSNGHALLQLLLLPLTKIGKFRNVEGLLVLSL